MNRDLLLAILAMDSYNRGYEERISNLGDDPIGELTLLTDALVELDEADIRDSSFYAAAYRLGEGENSEIVISFRGTDNWNFASGDPLAGFPAGLGFRSRQGLQAIEFYRAIADQYQGSKITVTGHSLGGGLAGLTSSLYGLDASVYNNMAFEDSSQSWFDAASEDEAESLRVYGVSTPPQAPNFSGVAAFETVNDFLGLVNRRGQTTAVTPVDSSLDLIGFPGPIARQVFFHSISGHVLLQWNRGKDESWRQISEVLWPSFFSDDVAASIPEAAARDAAPRRSEGTLAVMQSAIAYSAIGDTGTDASRPFGNTSINALFDDANQLGRADALQNTGVLDTLVGFDLRIPPTISLKEVLSNILVQYAGALALHDVEWPSGNAVEVEGEPIDPRKGVLALEKDDGTTTLALDLSNILWKDVLNSASEEEGRLGGDALKVINREEAENAFYAQQSAFGGGFVGYIADKIGLTPSIDQLKAVYAEVWGIDDLNDINRFHYILREDGGDIKLSERSYDPGGTKGEDANVDVAIFDGGEQTVTGTKGNDLLFLGSGDDTVYTLTGKDLLIGEAGDDTFINNVIAESASEDEGADEEDVFVGQRLGGSVFGNFLSWLTAPRSDDAFDAIENAADQFDFWAEDVVRYSVADPNVVPDLGESVSLAPKGVELVNLEKTTFGEYDALRVTVKDLNSGKISSDILVNIDVIELSERAETVEVTDAFSELPIVLDLGDVQTGDVTSEDYDTISFAKRSEGVFTANGAIRDWDDNPDNRVTLGSFQVLAELLATATGAIFDAAFTPAAALHFRGAENVTLSNEDDLYFGGNITSLLGLDSDFFGTPNHPGYGKISGGEGEDVIVHYGPRFIFEDEYIDVEQQALADARDEALANGQQYDGEEPDPNAARAGADLQLVVDGGADDDRIFVLGGEAAIVVGGEGTDLLYNGSFKGQLFGDGRDGLGAVQGERDFFWWSAGSFIMDAGKNDRLQLFGLPLIGGTNEQYFGRSLEKGVARDFFIPWVTYGLTSTNQLLVESSFSGVDLDPNMSEEEILEVAQVVQNWESGDLGIEFSIFGDGEEELLLKALFRFVGDFARAGIRFAKSLFWRPEDDPLVLDLNGDGFVSKGIGAVYWDNDEDGFGERSGWLSGEDGFLVHDADGDGNITASELFGGPGLSGFTELTDWDTNGDNIVDANDVGFGDLQIWRDANENGITDAGELHALAAFDITAFSLNAQPTNLITANGTEIRAESFFARSDGTTGGLGELIFEIDPSDTQYLGDARVASFAPEGMAGLPINAFGYGITTDLAVAASNDLELAQLIESTAAGMTVPDLDVLRDQARGVLGAWARSHSDSLELGAALVGADGSLADFAVYNEDENGGFWTLNSGADVLASDGSVIARASFEDVLAQTATGGASWQAIQGWTPSSRGFTPENRLETAYLISTNGPASVLDYAIRQSDAQGEFWTLASGDDVLASDGSIIARASLDDIMAQASAEGTAWRIEEFADPIPDAGFDRAAFNIRDGVVVDYSIWIDDGNGLFAVWASVFEQALESQERFGPNSFGLRGFELDLDNLPDADNSDDSVVRVEIMSLDEILYAFASGGETFRPELFVAQSASDNTLSYDFDIDDTKEFAGTLAESYLAIGRAMAVRIATQGGLAEYFEGVQYDAATDTFQATSNRELIPLFTAILADAPAGADETVDYLREWDRVLQTVYPDFKRNGNGPRSQAFLMQMIVAGFENSPVDASFLQVAEALSINEERVLIAESGSEDVEGTRGDDLIYIADGAASARGGLGSDVYIIGRDFGEVLIEDVEPILQPGASDYLRFAHLTPDDVFVTKDGADLIIQEIGTDNVITIKNQFEGRWPSFLGGDFSDNTEIVEINFADGTAWDFVDMAYAASHPLDSADVVFGTDAIDVLDGGAGNDILRGGGDGDLYIFDYGYGEDRIIDAENNPFRDATDLVVFGDGIDADRLSFERIGSSNDLIVHLLGEDGARTGDILTIEGQFFQQDAFITTLKPNRIEILAFEDGTFLDEQGIRDRVVAEARTDGEDAIWAFDEAETLDGGAGNDLLVGQDGADTYIFARGYGDDVIQDRSFEVGIGVEETVNALQLQGINAADIEILREPGSPTVSLRIQDTGETVTLKNQFEVTFAFFIVWRDNVDLIQFGDGTVWDQDRLGREVLSIERTDGDDTIIGFDWSDTLDGGAGNDRLEGGLFNDTYIFREGYGNDTVFDTGAENHPLLPAGFDRLDLRGIDLVDVEFSRQANDLTLTLRSTGESVTLEGQYDRLGDTVIEELRFNGLAVDWQDLGADDIDLIGSSGDDTLIGTHYAERIDGRGGNDILIGSSDGDTYVFDIGYGQDVINDRIDAGSYRASDTIEFGANVQFADVRFTKEGNDLFISIEGFTDTLRVLDQFGSVLSGVENFVFADGNSLTIEDVEEQLQIAGGTRGDNILNAIDDRPNILDGRQGDDQLNGGSFSDTYLFGVEYGFDTITEKLDSESDNGAVDRVVFGRLVNPDDVVFRADGLDLIVTIPSSGEQLTIVDGLGNRQIEEFDFFDGTVWGQAEIRAAIVRGTDADDLLIGFDNSDEVIAGGLGNDLLVGKAGNDTYRFNIGDGLDAIEDSAGVDRIELGEGISADMLRFSRVDEGLLVRFDGVEDSLLVRGGLEPSSAVETIALSDGFEFEFEDIRSLVLAGQATANDDIITGFENRADRLEGGAGNDELLGATGDDFYLIGENPGLDIIADTGGLDRIRFSVGRSDAVSVRRIHPGSGDIAISFEGLEGETVVRSAFANSSAIEEFEFADGIVLSNDDIRARLIEAAATDGNDLIQGFDDANAPAATFAGGRGDDILIGQANDDNFLFRRGDGSDVIIDQGVGTDTLQIEGYAPNELTFELLYEGSSDVLVTFAGEDDRIILRGQSGSNTLGVEQITFSDGNVISRSDINDFLNPGGPFAFTDGDDTVNGSTSSDVLQGGAGNDRIDANLGEDRIIGGTGNDTLLGGSQNDTYVFNLGDGQDLIRDARTNNRNQNRPGNDTIEFGAGITFSMLRFSTSGSDVIIDIVGTGDRLTIVGGFRNPGGNFETAIQFFSFVDGTTVPYSDVADVLIASTDGDDIIQDEVFSSVINGGLGDDLIYGHIGADTLIGGKGNDRLEGGSQADTYVFNLGDGQDLIKDERNNLQNANVPGNDTLQFGPGIDPSMLRFSSSGRTLIIDIDGSSDRISIANGVGPTTTGRFETVIQFYTFADGTTLTFDEVIALVDNTGQGQELTGTDIAENLSGSDGDDTISGLGGDDILDGGHDNDTVNGGEGNDTLIGGGGLDTLIDAAGDETYIFNIGDGRNTIVDSDGTDVIQFGAGISLSSLRVEASPSDLIVYVGSEGERIILSGAVTDAARRIETFEFADGSSQTYDEIASLAFFTTVGDGDFNLTDGDDTFAGDDRANSVSGLAGDDTIDGGDRSDTLSGDAGNDTLIGGFGNDTLRGGSDNDRLDGGLGDDRLEGGTENDTYIWRRGDGQDTILDSGGLDVIELAAGIESSDLIVVRSGTSDLQLRLAGSDDRLTIQNALSNSASQVEIVRFADGTEITHDDMVTFATLGTPGDDVYQGLSTGETLAGAAGNDRIFGNGGDDVLRGDAGNDRVDGGSGNDTITGGTGNDLLQGGSNDDTYIYAAGDGRDIVRDASGVDSVQISGLTSTDLTARRFEAGNDDLLLEFGNGNSILIIGGLAAATAVETITFVDSGETLTQADLVSRAISDLASADGDTIIGTDLADELTGGSGNDILAGGLGDDFYRFNLGDGIDRIVDTGGTADRIIFADFSAADITDLFRSPPAGDDLIITFSSGDTAILAGALGDGDEGVDLIEFSDGTTVTPDELRADLVAGFDTPSDAQVYGFSGNDTLAGGAGEDSLFGLEGDDTYIYRAGDGNDRIEDNGGGNDRIVIEGYASTDVQLSRLFYASTGVALNFIGAPSDSLTIINLISEGEDRIESIEFAQDGVVWDFATIEALVGNNAPIVAPDGFQDVVQGTVLAIDSESLLGNDFDADGDLLAIQSLGEVIGGSATLLADGTIEFTADPEFTGFASVAYLVTDGRQGVTEASVSIRVRPVAIANDDVGISVNEDETLIIRDRDLLANDVDGDRFEVAQVKDAVGGTVSLSSSGDITFTPFAEFNGEATFVYVANTPDGGRDEALVTIDVLAINDAPIARNDATGLSTDEGVPLTIDRADILALLNNDSDIDGDVLTITGVSGDGNVDAILNEDGSVLISPIGDFFGLASFTYLIDDGAGGTASATASLVVNPVNDVPVTQADSFVIDEDNPLFISGNLLTDNDFDPDGTPVVISAVRSAIGGDVELFENNTILFTPDVNFFGEAGFTYVVDDGEGGVTSQTVSITVDPINDAPVTRDDRPFGIGAVAGLITNQDQVLVIDPATILANDFDIEGDPVSIETVTGGVNGDVELRDDGLIYFTPDENYWGFANFRYVISDPEGLVDDGNVSVYFRPTGNVAPVAVDDIFTGVEDQPLIITRDQLLANDFDPNGDAIELVSVRSLGASANEFADFYFNDNGDLVIEPIADLPASGTLLYTISDGTFTDEGRLDVDFTPVDDAPTAGDDEDVQSGLGRPVVIRISDLTANDYDIDQSAWLPSGGFVHRFGADNLEILDTLSSTEGTASIYGDEFIVIEIDPAFSGDLTLAYTLSDDTGLTDMANVATNVRDNRDLEIEGSELRDLLIGSAEGETLIGLGGVDDLFGREGDDILRGGDGADILDGGAGFDIADFSDSEVALRVDINSRIGQGGFAQGDELISIEGLIGGLGSDQLFGTDELNTIAGSAGDDFIDGRDGDDVLSGDEGDDTIVGAEGADSIDGGEGTDTADYSDSADPVAIDLAAGTSSGGDAEGDTLISIENLIGTIGADSLTGDDGVNILIGGRGADTLLAGGGDDLIEGGRDGDIIDGGEGVDTARYWLSESGITIDLGAGTASGGDAEGDQLNNIENIIGSAHDDTITGDAADNVIAGLGGADALDGGDGIDTLDYNDSVGGISIDLTAGTGSAGDAAGDTVSNFENVLGSRFGDNITGDAGDNMLDGSIGDDTLAGADGSDRYILARGSGSDIINEGTALTDTDVLEIVGDFAPEAVSIYADGDDLIVELEQGEGIGSDQVRITDHFIGDGTGIETLIFGDGTVWDRETIDSNAGAGRLQAEGDIVRLVDEDVAFTFAASDLLVNDVSAEEAILSVVSVEAISGGSVTLNNDDTITFLGETNFNGDAFFRYRMTDGTGRISSAVVEVNVRPVNDAPVAVDDDGGYVVDEDGSVSIPFAWLLANDSDIDGDMLTINGFEEIDGGNGTATIEAAGFVTFRPNADYNGSAAFRYRLSDGNGGVDFATVLVEVLAVNDAPRPQSDNATVRSGMDVLISAASLLANDFDLEGDNFSFTGIGEGVNGTTALEIIDGAQFIRFTPDTDFVGSASFTYSVVEDGTGLTGTTSVDVTVLPPNDPPIARGETFDGLEDTPLVITQAELLANDTDPNGDTLTVSRLDEFPEQGSVAFDDDGNIVFTPAPDYNGPASFKYWVSDGEFEAEATASIEVAPINDAPVVVDDEGPFIGDEDKVFVIRAADVFGNDSDPEGDVLEFAEFETDIGTIALDGGNLLLTPPLNYNGTITVRYRARDDKGAISEDFASVTIDISDIADAPETVADSFTIAEDTPLELAAIDLIGNDTDVDSTELTLVAVENAVGGVVSLVDGVVTFTPNPDFFGTASFEYLVTDGDTNPVTGTATIEVTSVNDAARVVGDSFASDEDVALNLAPSAFLANDIDPDGDTITITAVTAITEGASAVIEDDGTITLTPPANESGQIRFEYTVSDGTVESTAQVSVFVAAVNDAPVLDAELVDLNSAEDIAFSFAIETGNFSDVDSSPLAFSAALEDGSPLPDWMMFDGANLTGTPPQHFNGTLNITVSASDGEFSASDTFALTIDPVNDAPMLVQMLSDISSDEDAAINFTLPADAFVDVDGDALALTAALSDGNALPDWLSFDGETFEGTPPQDFNGNLELTVTASDGEFSAEDTFVLSIDPVNDAPVLVQALSDVTSQEDVAISIAVPTDTFSDVDGDALALTATLSDGSDLPAWLSFDGTALTGTPPQDFNGSLDLTVTASDGELSVSDSLTLTLDPVNDAPTLVQSIEDANTAEDTAFAFAIPAETFADVDGDALTLIATLSDGSELPDWISFDGAGFTGTPPENFFGLIGLTVTASDGELSVSDNFTLQIASVNDAPELLQGIENAFSPEDTAISIALPANTFVDIDGDALTLTAALSDGSPLPDWLSFDGNAFTGTPPQDFSGAFDLTVTASDGVLSASDTFTLTVDPVNDAPTLVQALPNLAFAEDNAITVAVPPETFADVDGPALSITASISDGGDLPDWLSFDGATFTGTPPQDFNGVLNLVVTASDGELTADATFTLTIDPVNDAPVLVNALADVSSDEDAAISLTLPAGTFVDVDGDALSITATLSDGSALPAWLNFDGATFTGTPPQDFNGSFDLAVTASDGEFATTDNFTLTIDPVNDAPTLVQAIIDVEASVGDVLSIDLSAGVFADVDGDTLAFDAILSDGSPLPSWLTFAGGILASDSVPAEAGDYAITVTASDGEASANDSFVLTVLGGNTAPVAEDDGVFVTTANRTLAIDPNSLFDNDLDAEGDALTLVSVQDASIGEVSVDTDGNIIYIPDAFYTGEASFTYTVTDGEFTSTATVSIDIDPSDQFNGFREGNDRRNRLFGSLFGRNRIFGAGGNDLIVGGFASDDLAGGDGNDRIFGLFGNDDLYGGQGDDDLYGGFGFDTAHLLGNIEDYQIFTSGGFFNVTQTVDLNTAVDGNDGVDLLVSIESLQFKGGETLNIASPIILDLAGDGVQTLSADDSDALFDLDGDGLADNTSWIGANDAFLFLDRDGDGVVSGIQEISFIDDIEDAASDLEGLAAFDSNGDGILDAQDDRFDEFGIWNDADGDGAVDVGETATLREVGIASVNLDGTPVEGMTRFGEVAVANTGSFTLTNGTAGEFADAALTYFSAANNLPELSTTAYDFDRKAKKYRIHISDGVAAVDRKRRRFSVDSLAGQLGANTIISTKKGDYGRFAPVVLDLDGDGIEMVRMKRSDARFDYAGDGRTDKTGWLSGDDGFLVIDRNNDGLITEASELTLASEDETARTGLQGLANMDSNGDGVVDANDARFGELRVWQDRNENGRTDAGELITLADAGIVSVSLAATGLEDRVKLDRNAVTATSSFTRSNGTTSTVADVSLAYRPATGPAASTTFDAGFAFGSDLFLQNPRTPQLPREFPALDALFDQLRGDFAGSSTELFDRFAQSPSQAFSQSQSEPNTASDPSQFGFVQTPSQQSARTQTTQALPNERVTLAAFNDDASGEVFFQTDAALERWSTDRQALLRGDVASNGQRNIPAPSAQGSLLNPEADLARKLMMIRQEMGAFGGSSAVETDRLHSNTPDHLYFYA